jgi:hypothetical protein
LESLFGKVIRYLFMGLYGFIVLGSAVQIGADPFTNIALLLGSAICLFICTQKWAEIEENRIAKKIQAYENVQNLKGIEKVRESLPVGNKNRFKASALIFWSFLILGTLLASITKTSQNVETSNQPVSEVASVESEKPIVSVKASQLYSDYKANEARASQKYNGKRIKITGIVSDIDQTFGDEPLIHLKTPDMFMNVTVHLVPEEWEKAIDLNKGQEKTWICDSVEEIVGQPILKDCSDT